MAGPRAVLKSVAAADNAEVSTALAKLPISRHDGVFLLDPEKAIYLQANGHYTVSKV